MDQITYRKLTRYKYQLLEEYTAETGIETGASVATADDWVKLTDAGTITLKQGYAWDGPSGPTIDTHTFMRGSLVHDGFYQLMREGLVGLEHRDAADRVLRRMCLDDGMSSFRAAYVYRIVKWRGEGSARPRPPSTVTRLVAPR